MQQTSTIDETLYLDPVFADFGVDVYTNEYADILRAENLELKRKGQRIYNIIPQAGFQEKVLTSDADLVICGGSRGSGKTAVSLIGAFYYAENPDVNLYGFRRYEADVKRGIWKSCKPLFRGFASFGDTNYEAKFFGGSGAVMKMEHLADLKQVKDRFRGAEMPYIVIEELAEFTKENLNVIFDLMGSNRSTSGVRPRFICTCNPVGKSNKLRWFLDWWIDPVTDEAIPERSGVLRYFVRYGEDISEIAWGGSPEEVYANPNARAKIASLTDNPDADYKSFITSVTFIDGAYSENEILHVSDPKYMNRISSGGSKATINDIRGVWRDVDDTGALVTASDMARFFANSPQTSGRKVGGADIALREDWFIQWALDGWHIVDVDAARWLTSEDVIPRIKAFQRRNGIADEDFAFDVNGMGNWVKQSEDMRHCFGFDNKAPARDKTAYTTRKSECAGILVEKLQNGELSIEPEVLRRTFKENKTPFSVEERLMVERLILKWRDIDNPKTLIKKIDMKALIGHSPDFIEALIYAIDRADNAKRRSKERRGNWGFFM